KLRVWVDHDVCVGNAMCETIAPKVFRLNDNRQSEAVDPAGDTVEKILEAAENCPVSAIFVEDAVTGEQLFPQYQVPTLNAAGAYDTRHLRALEHTCAYAYA